MIFYYLAYDLLLSLLLSRVICKEP